MVMIALLQLVLDWNRLPVCVFGDHFHIEGTSGVLTIDSANLRASSVRKNVDVLLQPSSGVVRFMTPHTTQCYSLDAPDPVLSTRCLGIQFAQALTLCHLAVRTPARQVFVVALTWLEAA